MISARSSWGRHKLVLEPTAYRNPLPTPWPKLSLVSKNCFTNMAVWLTGPRRQWVVLGSFIPRPYSGNSTLSSIQVKDFTNSNIRFSWSHQPGELDYLQLFLWMYDVRFTHYLLTSLNSLILRRKSINHSARFHSPQFFCLGSTFSLCQKEGWYESFGPRLPSY